MCSIKNHNIVKAPDFTPPISQLTLLYVVTWATVPGSGAEGLHKAAYALSLSHADSSRSFDPKPATRPVAAKEQETVLGCNQNERLPKPLGPRLWKCQIFGKALNPGSHRSQGVAQRHSGRDSRTALKLAGGESSRM